MNLGLLGLPSKSRSHGPAFKTQSPEQGDGCRYLPNLLDSLPSLTNRWESSSHFGVFPFLMAGYAAAVIGVDRAGRSGSYTSPLAHNRCSKTASLRATAIAARFFAFFPSRSHSRNPYRRKSVSGPMVVKAAEGTWNVGVTIAGKVLSEALAKYYGLP